MLAWLKSLGLTWPIAISGALAVGVPIGLLIRAILMARSHKAVAGNVQCELLRDSAATIEGMRPLLRATQVRFDLMAVTGSTFVRKWATEIVQCADRGVRFRFLISNANADYIPTIAAATGKKVDVLKQDLIDTLGVLEEIRGRLVETKADRIAWKQMSHHAPLASMWLRDDSSSESAMVNIQVHFNDANGPAFRYVDPETHARLLELFDREWQWAI